MKTQTGARWVARRERRGAMRAPQPISRAFKNVLIAEICSFLLLISVLFGAYCKSAVNPQKLPRWMQPLTCSRGHTCEHMVLGSGVAGNLAYDRKLDLAERRRTDELRRNEEERVGCSRKNHSENGTDQRRKQASRDGRGYSRVCQRAYRTGVICRAGTRRMNMDGSNKPCQRDQHDAAHRYGGIRPALDPQVGLRLHSGSLNQFDAT